jgi:hypothetical protein
MSFLPHAVDGKKRSLKDLRPGRDQAMDRRDDWRETENCFFDATCASENEWKIDTTSRTNNVTPDARPSGKQGRIMVIGFHVIRV